MDCSSTGAPGMAAVLPHGSASAPSPSRRPPRPLSETSPSRLAGYAPGVGSGGPGNEAAAQTACGSCNELLPSGTSVHCMNYRFIRGPSHAPSAVPVTPGRLGPARGWSAARLVNGGGSMQEIKFGDVGVTRVVEYHGDAGTSPEDITPGIPVELWRENRAWLQPDHVNAGFTSYVGALQTWVLRSEGKTILVDTGAGNGKDRPLAMFAHLHTSFLADLAAAGVAPQDVDVVVNTHLHLDHTG